MVPQLLFKNLVHNVCSCTAANTLSYYALHAHAHTHRTGLDAHSALGYDVRYVHTHGLDPHTGNAIVSSSLQSAQICNVFDGSISRTFPISQINAYLKCGQSRHALAVYQQMQKGSSNLTVYTFLALLKACAKLRDVEIGCEIHAELARTGVSKKNPFVGNTLVHMYAKCGSLGKAQEVFDTLTAPDVVTWTALIGGYAQHRRGHEALKCFERMHLQGVSPNDVTYACCLKACGSIGAIEKGRQIHADVECKRLLETNQFVGNALVDMYAKCGMLAKAKEVFAKLPLHDTISWNALITGYVDNKSAEEALLCFKTMQSEGVSPDVVTFSCSLKACATIAAIDEGRKIHDEINKRRLLEREPDLGSALLDMYVKCGMLSKAQEVFDQLPVRDVVTWTALIGGYVQCEQGEAALHFFNRMRLEGISSDAFLLACILKACGNIGALAIAEDIHEEIIKKNLLRRDLGLCNALVDMYAKCGNLKKAQEVFENLSVCNLVSWNALISGYALLGEIEDVLVYVDRMRGEGYDPNLVTFVAVLNACSHAGLIDKGKFCFKAMKEGFGITPAPEHYTCIVDLLGRAGQVDSAIALMKNAPFHFDIVMWLTVLGACRKWGNVDLGRQAFQEAVGVDETDAAAYICMYNICAGAYVDEDVHLGHT